MIAKVAIVNANKSFDMLFSYLVEDEMKDIIMLGDKVRVPFGKSNRNMEGYVFGLNEQLSENASDIVNESDGQITENKTNKRKLSLKSVIEIVTKKDIRLTEEQIKLATWMKKRYMCTYSQAVRCMLPSYTDTSGSKTKFARLAVSKEEAQRLIDELVLKKINHIMIIDMLIDNDELPAALITACVGVGTGVLNTLKKHGYIELFDKVLSKDKYVEDMEIEKSEAFQLNEEQQAAYDRIIAGAIQGDKEKVFLLHGVTGSGKTEVYLHLIDTLLTEGRGAIVLVPEISLTPLMIRRFESRFKGKVAVLHSRMTVAEKRKSWQKIHEGKASVVIGPRSAVFAPVKNLGLIVIDEEHETTYKSEMVPKYHALEIARFRVAQTGAAVVLGSATPSIENYYKAKSGEFELLTMNERTNSRALPEVNIVDMTEELKNGNQGMFSRQLLQEMRANVNEDKQTILFINKRGYSSFVMCRECGHVVECDSCSIPMKYHKNMNRMICHYCGNVAPNVGTCPECGSKKIKQFGTGTQKVEEEIKKLFPEASVLRMDMDTTSGRESHRAILEKFENEKVDFLIGTQMITKGLDFENVTLVGILDADSALFANEFRGGERAFQQITQAAGRAGRGRYEGRVVVQTYNNDNATILAAAEQDYNTFYENEILLRERLNVPPFENIGVMIIHGVDKDETAMAAKEVHEFAMQLSKRFVVADKQADKRADKQADTLPDNRAGDELVKIYEPGVSPISRINNRCRWRVIVKSKRLDVLVKLLSECSDKIYADSKREIEMSVDINPYNMV